LTLGLDELRLSPSPVRGSRGMLPINEGRS
jgi:hypothetical protein